MGYGVPPKHHTPRDNYIEENTENPTTKKIEKEKKQIQRKRERKRNFEILHKEV